MGGLQDLELEQALTCPRIRSGSACSPGASDVHLQSKYGNRPEGHQ